MSIKTEKLNVWLLRLLSFAAGAGVIWLLRHGHLKSMLLNVYQSIGITVVALAPLAAWAIYTVLRAESKGDLTLAYIGTTSQRVGLLGTVVGIVAATIAIGDHLHTGAATAVTSALPAVGQALVSTAVGFVIAIVCDFFRYLNLRNSDEDSHSNQELDNVSLQRQPSR